MDITSRNGNGFDTHGMTGIGRVHCVFGKDDRIVVSKCDAIAAHFSGSFRNPFRTGLVLETIHFTAFGNIPVLSELAGQIAAGSSKAEHAASRVEMVERFLFNRVDAKAGAAAIRRQHHRIGLAGPDKTQPSLSVMQPTFPRAKITLNSAIIQSMPPTGRITRRSSGMLSEPVHAISGRLKHWLIKASADSNSLKTRTR